MPHVRTETDGTAADYICHIYDTHRADGGQNGEVNSMLHLQRTIGNQAARVGWVERSETHQKVVENRRWQETVGKIWFAG